MAVILNNTGRIKQQIPGISGVGPSGLMLVNLPVNARYHRLLFFCTNNGVASTAQLTSCRVLVNSVNVRDISPQNVINIAKTQGVVPSNGVLPIYFTRPWANLLVGNDTNSWDLAGQSTFSVQIGIAANAVNPTITGLMEFDYVRNTIQQGNAQQPYLAPVSQHQFLWNGAAGRNDITILPFDFPVSRLYFESGLGNSITLVEIYQDGNKIVEGTPAQLNEAYSELGLLLGGANPFEAAAIFDDDQRWWKSLKAANSFIVRITLAVADTINIVQESLPGAYAA